MKLSIPKIQPPTILEAIATESPPKLPSNKSSLVILGFDADRKENTVQGILDWMVRFQSVSSELEEQGVAFLVFVVDWPRESWQKSGKAKLTDQDIYRFLETGICYRPKQSCFYDKDGSFRDSLEEDLVSSGITEPVSLPTSADKRTSSEVQETKQFLASQQFVWPSEQVLALFGQPGNKKPSVSGNGMIRHGS